MKEGLNDDLSQVILAPSFFTDRVIKYATGESQRVKKQ